MSAEGPSPIFSPRDPRIARPPAARANTGGGQKRTPPIAAAGHRDRFSPCRNIRRSAKWCAVDASPFLALRDRYPCPLARRHSGQERTRFAQRLRARCPTTGRISSGASSSQTPCCDVIHRSSAFPTTSGGSGQSSVSQMARSSSASRTVICWFARMQAAQATTIRRLMAGTD